MAANHKGPRPLPKTSTPDGRVITEELPRRDTTAWQRQKRAPEQEAEVYKQGLQRGYKSAARGVTIGRATRLPGPTCPPQNRLGGTGEKCNGHAFMNHPVTHVFV